MIEPHQTEANDRIEHLVRQGAVAFVGKRRARVLLVVEEGSLEISMERAGWDAYAASDRQQPVEVVDGYRRRRAAP